MKYSNNHLKAKVSISNFYIVFIILFVFHTSHYLYAQEKYDINYDILLKEIKNESVDVISIQNYIQQFNNIDKAARINLTERLVSDAFDLKKYSLAYDLRLFSIQIGKSDCLILEDQLGQYLRKNNIEKYRKLENEYYLHYNNYLDQYSPNVNREICFVLHRMVRLDQRTKFEANNNQDSTKNDFLWDLVRVQDSLNEILFGQIIEEFGYPGKSLVGFADMSIGYILMLHMSTKFQMKYVYLLKKAYDEKELYSNIPFLIDKILYKCCRKSIYGNWVGEGLAQLETDPKAIELLLKQLKL